MLGKGFAPPSAAMNSCPRIGAANPIISERAALIDWLGAAGCEPVPMFDLASLPAALASGPLEALIADAALVTEASLPGLLRTLGANRPLVLIGEPSTASPAVLRAVRWLDRPVTKATLILAVTLALGEGRPARRSPRKQIKPITASVDGVRSRVLDVSLEGVRFEVAGARPLALPPEFTLRIPEYGVASTVRRVWVRQGAADGLWCGGRVMNAAARATSTWRQLVETTPVFGSHATLVDEWRGR
jgi:hypothetical protein